MAARYGITMTRSPEAGVPLVRIETPRLVYAVIAVCTAVAAFLRFYQLTRPGYLLGVTEYDDGVQFGDAARLVSGVIPYRDFVAMQPPGSVLLMAPVAALAKVTGSAWGLAIARLLTAAADTASVALLGLLVKHRGPVAAGIACGIYAVYPDALVAAAKRYDWSPAPAGWEETLSAELRAFLPDSGTWHVNEQYAEDVRTAKYNGAVYLDTTTGTVVLRVIDS